jgi:hypothetical protein
MLDEVTSAIKRLKQGKAPGLDGVPADLIIFSGEAAVKVLHKLCVKVWNNSEWPDAWKKLEMVVLYKAGSTKECSNYRTIALICHASKIMLIIILERIRKKIEEEQPDEQSAYRKGRGTADMLCCIQVLIEKTLAMSDQACYILFIDYSKAFDSISQIQLFDMMNSMGFPRHIVSLIQGLYINQTSVIRWNGKHTEPFPIGKGVRQGCILSPALFCAYTEIIMREADIGDKGILLGGRHRSNFRYADDTALTAGNEEDINEITHSVNNAGTERLLKLNAKKTKLMVISKNETTPPEVCINNVKIEQVDKFKYLGSIKTDDGNCTIDIRARIGRAKKVCLELNNIWKDKDVRKDVKVKLLKALVWPIVSYGAEGWTLKKADENRIMAAEMWFYRRMLRISWTERRTNKGILNELNVRKELLGRIVKRKLSFFGHSMRQHGNELVKECITGTIPGKRRRGRPGMQYVDNVKKWSGRSLISNIRSAEDRAGWKDDMSFAIEAAQRQV